MAFHDEPAIGSRGGCEPVTNHRKVANSFYDEPAANHPKVAENQREPFDEPERTSFWEQAEKSEPRDTPLFRGGFAWFASVHWLNWGRQCREKREYRGFWCLLTVGGRAQVERRSILDWHYGLRLRLSVKGKQMLIRSMLVAAMVVAAAGAHAQNGKRTDYRSPDPSKPMYVEAGATMCNYYSEISTMSALARQGAPAEVQQAGAPGCFVVPDMSRAFVMERLGSFWHVRVSQPNGVIFDGWTIGPYLFDERQRTKDGIPLPVEAP